MPARKTSQIRKCITAPREKSYILEKSFCTERELKIIKDWIKKGAVFIVMGSEYTYTDQFYKGLHQLMYAPTSNGAAIYDAHYEFRKAFERPYVVIALNDPNNTQHIDNIRLLDRYRNKTLYAAKYDN